MLAHIEDLYGFYGIERGLRVARKHISWYTKGLVGSASFRHAMNQLETVAEQRAAIDQFFASLGHTGERLVYDADEAGDELAAELAA